MNRCCVLLAPKKPIGVSGASRPKRVSYTPQGDVKAGKNRITFLESIQRDRDAAQARRELPLLERIKALPIIPFIVFMTVWSIAGLYIVPWIKGLKPGEYPTIKGKELTEEQKAKICKTPVIPTPSEIIGGMFGGGKGMLSGAEPKIKL